MEKEVLSDYKKYFVDKINEFGATPKGVDYNSFNSQEIRFRELAKCIDEKSNFSILDFGCGYGAMLEYLHKNYTNFDYTGCDIIEEMITSAREKNKNFPDAKWETQLTENKTRA